MSPPRKQEAGEPVQTSMVRQKLVRVHQQTGRNSRVYRIERTDGERTWEEPLWSVTTLLKAIDKAALPRWAARAVATEAVRARAYIGQDVERYGEEEVIRRLADSPYRTRSRAGDIGTAVHGLIDAHIRGVTPPAFPPDLEDEIVPRFEQFLRFLEEWAPSFHEDPSLAAEVTCFHPEHGWAGTLDLIADIGTRGAGVIDVKNTNASRDGDPGVYMEHALQISAYAHAKEIAATRGLWVEPLPMPEIHWGAVLWLAKDRYALIEVDISAKVYRAFLVAAELWRYVDGPGKDAVLGSQSPSAYGVFPTVTENTAAARGDAVISEPQRRRMLALAAEHGLSHAQVKAIIVEMLDVSSTTRVPVARYEEICEVLSGRGGTPATAGGEVPSAAHAGVESAGADSPGAPQDERSE